MADKELRVLWISGNRKEREALLEKAKRSFLLSKDNSSSGDSNIIRIDSSNTLEELSESILTDDCFASRRIVLVSSLPSFTGNRPTFVNHLKKVITATPTGCLLIFYGISPDDERAIYSHVSNVGRTFDFPETLPFVDAESRIAQAIKEAEKEIEPEASVALAHTLTPVGSKAKVFHIDHIDIVIQKLLLYVDKRKKITSEDVAELSTAMPKATVWQVMEAIDERNYEKATASLERLCLCETQGDWKVLAGDFLRANLWRYRLMVFLKQSQAASMSNQQIIDAALQLQSLSYKQSDDGERKTYTIQNIQSMLQSGFGVSVLDKYSRKRVISIMETLECISAELFAPDRGQAMYRFMLDIYLMVACEKIDDKRRRTLWYLFEYDNE